MPKYALFFSYTSDAWDAMVGNPRDRAAQARAIVEAADGTMEAIRLCARQEGSHARPNS